VQDERNECEPSASVLTRLHELADRLAHLQRRLVADQTARTLEDATVAESFDLGLDLVDLAAKPRREAVRIENGVGICPTSAET
jgi:hypothetical protein